MANDSVAPRVTLEVCIASVADALAAQAGGADRLELNLALELGGLTPSVGLLEEVKQAVSIPVLVMLRPRPAGFCYSTTEKRTIVCDAERLLSSGADGLVCGALLPDRSLDTDFWTDLTRVTSGRPLVFHRAFDSTMSSEQLLEQLVDFGTTRILTSGGEATALAGARHIRRLMDQAQNRIEILPGAGVSESNVAQIVEATGCRQVHGSFRVESYDEAGVVGSSTFWRTDNERVAAVRKVLDTL